MLNRVAVTTLLFLGSTAPIAMSGVSTTATSLGGAVRTAARPKRTEKSDDGVPMRGYGLSGVKGVLGDVDGASDARARGSGVLGIGEGATREPRRCTIGRPFAEESIR